MEKEVLKRGYYTGERALFGAHDLTIEDATFADGESPLKESARIALCNSLFKWKYPIWYANDISLSGCHFFETARAGVWYTNRFSFTDGIIDAPKTFRRCHDLTLSHVTLPHAAETLWSCEGVRLSHVSAHGDYFAMNSKHMEVEDFTLVGNYSFDGVEDVTVRRAKLLTKDAFWNSRRVTVEDSFISGEYLGWNAEDLTLINCTIESLQGLCYIKNLRLINCTLINTTLAFEYSTVEADITGKVDSVLNPSGGRITADAIGELIIEKDRIDPTKTVIVCRGNAQ